MATALTSPPQAPIADAVLCARCGYDLRGLLENRCPECGETFDPSKFPSARLPWLIDRDTISAPYLATVRQVIAHPWDLGRLVWMPVWVDEKRAERFRRITMWIAIVCLCATAALGSWLVSHDVLVVDTVILSMIPTAWTFFELATRPGRDLGHWAQGGQQNIRTIGLYHFCCAPLAMMPLVPATVIAISLIGVGVTEVFLAAAGSLGVVLFVWWIVEVAFQAASTRGLVGDGLRAGAIALVHWAAFAITALLICGITSLVLYEAIVPWLLKLFYRR